MHVNIFQKQIKNLLEPDVKGVSKQGGGIFFQSGKFAFLKSFSGYAVVLD
jgi:hypothetical protein